MEIVLASNSPRRRELLTKMGLSFEVKSPECDENLESDIFSYEVIEKLALDKATSLVGKVSPNSIIIGADTVVIHEDKILGKPMGEADALRMLKLLNNATHKVVTSVCVISNESNVCVKSTTTEVTFNELSDKQIKDYIRTCNPFDKAGAYGIQELPDYFVKEIKGELDNVIGLPCKTLQELLKST